MKTIQVAVSQRHIDEGQVCNCDYCPVALGLVESIAPVRSASVACNWAHVFTTEGFWNVKLPTIVAQFIRDFDAGRPVSAFSFPLDVPDEVLA